MGSEICALTYRCTKESAYFFAAGITTRPGRDGPQPLVIHLRLPVRVVWLSLCPPQSYNGLRDPSGVKKPELDEKEASSLKNIAWAKQAVTIVDDSAKPSRAQKAMGAPNTNVRAATPIGSSLKTQRTPKCPLPEVRVSAANNIEARRKARMKFRRPHSSRTPQRTTRNARINHQSARSRFSNTRSMHCRSSHSLMPCPSVTVPTTTSSLVTTAESTRPPRQVRRSVSSSALRTTRRATRCRSRISSPSTSELVFILSTGHRRHIRSCLPRRGKRSVLAYPKTLRLLRSCAPTPALRGVPFYGERSIPLVHGSGGGLRHELSYSSFGLRDVTNAPHDIDQRPCCEASLMTEEHVDGIAYLRPRVLSLPGREVLERREVRNSKHGRSHNLPGLQPSQRAPCRVTPQLPAAAAPSRAEVLMVPVLWLRCRVMGRSGLSSLCGAGDAMTRVTSGTTVPAPASHYQAQHDMSGDDSTGEDRFETK
ncbi:hypothetical protein MRX96_028626 [Rhipicephalus microplus]